MDILNRVDLFTAAHHFERACAVSRLHSRQAQRALANYGDHGASISGCVRDHFPSRVKDELRSLAQLVTKQSDAGYAARPSRVRFTTMRHLARSIATRDGSGFYGPQPYRETGS